MISENTRLANIKKILAHEIRKKYPDVIINAEDAETIPQILRFHSIPKFTESTAMH